jgi:mevalonate kinase
MDFNFNISELVSIIALLIAIISGYVNTKIQITKLMDENRNMLEKINKLDKKLSEICSKVDRIKIILAKEGINNDNE